MALAHTTATISANTSNTQVIDIGADAILYGWYGPSAWDDNTQLAVYVSKDGNTFFQLEVTNPEPNRAYYVAPAYNEFYCFRYFKLVAQSGSGPTMEAQAEDRVFTLITR